MGDAADHEASQRLAHLRERFRAVSAQLEPKQPDSIHLDNTPLLDATRLTGNHANPDVYLTR